MLLNGLMYTDQIVFPFFLYKLSALGQGSIKGTVVRIIDSFCIRQGGKQVCLQTAPLLYLLFRQQDAAMLLFTAYSVLCYIAICVSSDLKQVLIFSKICKHTGI